MKLVDELGNARIGCAKYGAVDLLGLLFRQAAKVAAEGDAIFVPAEGSFLIVVERFELGEGIVDPCRELSGTPTSIRAPFQLWLISTRTPPRSKQTTRIFQLCETRLFTQSRKGEPRRRYSWGPDFHAKPQRESAKAL